MPVALPPPLPPQPGAVLLQSRDDAAAVLHFQRYRLHLLGTPVIDKVEAAAAIEGADTLSNAVRHLAAACYAAGYPTAQLRYMLEGDDLYVLVVTGRLNDVRVGPLLAPYFRGLDGEAPLTDAALEPRRLLAGVHADRAGVEAQLRLQPRSDGYLLDVETSPPHASDTAVKLEVSNPGNRYVGRYFSDLGLRHVRASGDEYVANWRHGLVALDEDAQASAYDEGQLSFSRVTPLGLFGLAGQHVDYDQRLADNVEAEGRLQQAALTWLTPVAANFSERWTLNLRLDYTRQRLRAAPLAERREGYSSLEAGAVYDTRVLGWNLDASLQLRQGLGGSVADEVATDYLALRPKLRLQRGFGQATASIEARGQWSEDSVPEQSQWLLGGADHLSAWLPGVAVGDRGWLAQATTGYRWPWMGSVALDTRVFAEYGTSRSAEGNAPAVGLGDAGVALGLKYRESLEAEVSFAQPLHESGGSAEQREDAEAGVLFRVTWKF